MKAIKFCTMISLLLVSYLAAIAQDASTVGSASSSSPLSISLETGRYDPEPGCKKEVDGCFPKLWTPERQFKVGSQVWVKITVVNHSDQVADHSFSCGVFLRSA